MTRKFLRDIIEKLLWQKLFYYGKDSKVTSGDYHGTVFCRSKTARTTVCYANPAVEWPCWSLSLLHATSGDYHGIVVLAPKLQGQQFAM